ncbi:RdgB/HAM1 family non-canonical purine NTP pyrophosphatase [Methyloterricola oryzae]|uniref:RdgB/HAM1 family non-canonical purine NTP pyrophosphatase n=1 Tax=Methyloterricola oryzae TaxID=1495050 RepID=UPI0005EBBCD9|nr:RdgB/HAM1 family non-canonical purine NTP pyrophosphatase [Methyloterricola oryzae]
MGNSFVLASSNPGKLREFQALLAPMGAEIAALSAFTATQADETGATFLENALIKARHAALCSGLPAIADDSGLEVDALAGAPGVRSARFAGPDADDAANNAKLLQALSCVPEAQRLARFRCVLVFLRHADDASPVIAQGVWVGRIALSPGGRGGFGYDPLFFLPELGCTAAELESEIKNRLSHRGQAVRALLAQLREVLGILE